MSAVGHYLEQEGIATVQISLIREHTAALKAPRALWVPFMLGRPFGTPGDKIFQRRVLMSALSLLQRTDGPVLADFPEEAPADDLGVQVDALACPVSFPRPNREAPIESQFEDEISQLLAWHRLAQGARNRTTLGVTGCSPARLGAFIASWLTDNQEHVLNDTTIEPAQALKFATDELKAFYLEAKAAQPGRHTAASLQEWFWFDTAAGEIFLRLRAKLAQDGDAALKGMATLGIVPRAVLSLLSTRKNGIG